MKSVEKKVVGHNVDRQNADLTVCQQTKCRFFFVGGYALNTGYFPTKDMQTPPLPFSFAPVLMKDAQCAESNEKSYFRFFQFLVFEIWSSLEFFPTKDMQTLPLSSIQFLWVMGNVLKRMNDHNSKNKFRKNLKFHFSFYPVDSASFI